MPLVLITHPRSIFYLYNDCASCELATLISEAPLPETDIRFAGTSYDTVSCSACMLVVDFDLCRLCTAACVAQALKVLQDELHLLHRNLTPLNLTVTRTGYVVLMDYRLAKEDDGSRLTLCGPVRSYQ